MQLPGQENFQKRFYTMVQKAPVGVEPGDSLRERDLLSLLAGWKDLALEAARSSGYVVVSADNRQAPARTGYGMENVIYFSALADNVIVKRHLGVGGTAVFIREGQVLAATGGRAYLIVETNRVSYLNRHSMKLEDALAAAAGFLALGMHPGEIYHRRFMEGKAGAGIESVSGSIR